MVPYERFHYGNLFWTRYFLNTSDSRSCPTCRAWVAVELPAPTPIANLHARLLQLMQQTKLMTYAKYIYIYIYIYHTYIYIYIHFYKIHIYISYIYISYIYIYIYIYIYHIYIYICRKCVWTLMAINIYISIYIYRYYTYSL